MFLYWFEILNTIWSKGNDRYNSQEINWQIAVLDSLNTTQSLKSTSEGVY